MKKLRFLSYLLTTLALVGVCLAGDSSSDRSPIERAWFGPDGEVIPLRTDEEILDFLRTAEVVSMQGIKRGITKPRKVLLERDGVQLHAVFRYLSKQKQRSRVHGAVRWYFRDDFIFECAAYELSRVLGQHSVPPVVPRKINGRKGTLQVWIENAMTEEMRRDRKLYAPDSVRWSHQRQQRLAFDLLVFNEDRNLGNTLIDQFWNVWLIDHTRAFHNLHQLRNPKRLRHCDRLFWERLNTLDREVVRERVKPFLRKNEIKALFRRWDRLIDFIQGLIEAKGEDFVLFELAGKQIGPTDSPQLSQR